MNAVTLTVGRRTRCGMQTVAWILFQHCSVLVSQMPFGAQ